MKRLTDDPDIWFCPCCKAAPDPILYGKIEQLRNKGYILRITSAKRCSDHNRQVGGSQRSQHLKGLAADIVLSPHCSGLSFLRDAYDLGARGIGIYDRHIHIDFRNQRYLSFWTG